MRAYGIDAAPVAVAIAQAKLATTNTEAVLDLFDDIVADRSDVRMPRGPFWEWCYEQETLNTLCGIRQGLMGRRSPEAIMLRAVMLGGLHGPRAKTTDGAAYFSNQMPRTFAAKPGYAVRFWKRHRRKAPHVNMRAIVERRVARAIREQIPDARTQPADVRCADSRQAAAFARIEGRITHVVTSPPYYGLCTYSQDQWLRLWFLGGPTDIEYGTGAGLDHGSPKAFAESLAQVWNNVGRHAAERIRLHIRFGGISSRTASAEDILRQSFLDSEHVWRIVTKHPAATADSGKRQALQMLTTCKPIHEHDYVVEFT